MKFDAILLAGQGKASKKIMGQNKSLLEIRGIPLFCYTLSALQKTPNIENIYVVGNKETLKAKIQKASKFLNSQKKITLVQQEKNMLKTAWVSFLKTLPDDPDNQDILVKNKEKAVLYIAGDTPLITHHEISEFLSNCDVSKCDYFMGITPKENLKSFYPSKEKLGIKMAYFHTKENRYRPNNLHLVKPIKLNKKEYIQDVYKYRYQGKLKNIVRCSMEMFCNGVVGKSLRFYFMLQFALFSSYMNWEKINSFFRNRLPKKEIEKCISQLLGTRFVGVETHFGGAAMDIDNRKDLEIMKLRFNEWRPIQEKLANKIYSASDSLQGIPQ